jgi:hypothetical protein
MSEVVEFEFLPITAHEITTRDDGSHDMVPLTGPECDFCLDCRVRWLYDCGRVFLEAYGFGSEGRWAACDFCAAMIDAGDREGLAARSIRSWELREMPKMPYVEHFIREIQAAFMENREGPKIAFG